MKDNLQGIILSKYGDIAKSALSSDDPGVQTIAKAFGYSEEELRRIPAAANMGLSCGNPTATAALRLGEVVVDLGSGGGLDVFLAAQKVGPHGRVIGIDMAPGMIERAKKNAEQSGCENVEFHLASIDALPVPEASVDCVISNCVINLAPDKQAVFREISRVLKPGGRLAVSDIALKKRLPRELAESVAAYVGCVAGALPIEDYVAGLHAAGFSAVQVVDSGSDLNVYKEGGLESCCCAQEEASVMRAGDGGAPSEQSAASCCGGSGRRQSLPMQRYDLNHYAASVKVFAVKP